MSSCGSNRLHGSGGWFGGDGDNGAAAVVFANPVHLAVMDCAAVIDGTPLARWRWRL